MSCGCRVTQHLKEWDNFAISSASSTFRFVSSIKLHRQKPGVEKGFILRRNNATRKFIRIPSPCLPSLVGNALPFITCLQSKFPRELPIFSDASFSQKEDDRELSSQVLSSIAGGIVALGKFDALHVGHRELAIQASKVGAPFLLSFVGMAEVLGWEPRAPIVAKCDRERVLSSWAPLCGNVAPKELLIHFAGVRHLTPRQFVEKLSNELGVRGVVAGENYRFGYKAAGDASELVRLCNEYEIQAYVINSVMDKNQKLDISCASGKKERGQVSSTRVRYALSLGDMNYVSELLGRDHRLIVSTQNKEDIVGYKNRISAPKSCLSNLPPKDGFYENCCLILDEDNQLQCKLFIDSTHIHLETDGNYYHIHDACQEISHFGIEFKGQGS